MKNQRLLADFPILQTYLFFYCLCDYQVNDVDNFANTHHVIAGQFSTKPHGRYGCHIWTQYGPYITILSFLICVHNMLHLHPLEGALSGLRQFLGQ